MQDLTLPTSTPGAGICEPSRKITMIIRTNSSLLAQVRRPESVGEMRLARDPLLWCRKAVGTVRVVSTRITAGGAAGTRTGGHDHAHLGVGPSRSCRHRSTGSGGGRGAAGSLDLLLGRGGERVRAHLQRHREVALAEDLDRLALADGALGDQRVDGDLAALGEQLGEAVEVDDLELDLRNGFLKPFSFGSRMWIGIWPPSKSPAPGSGPWCPWYRDRRSCPWSPHRDPPGSWRSWRREPGRRWCSF